MLSVVLFLCLVAFVLAPLVAVVASGRDSRGTVVTGRRCNVLGDAESGQAPWCWNVRSAGSRGYVLSHQETGELVAVPRQYVF